MISTSHLGDPEVLLAFEADGTNWELEKRFAAAKGSTRLTAQGGTAFRDEEAETKLASLLKTETASGRGAAGLLPDLWAHLWVWQGKAADDPSAHTTAHKAELIQQLQQNGVAAVLQSANDQRVAARIADAYAELFTATGKPKTGSKPELARVRHEEAAAAMDKAREGSARTASQAAEAAQREASENLRRARLQNDIAAAAVTVFEKNEALQAVAKRAMEAEEMQASLSALRPDLAKLPVLDAKDLARSRLPGPRRNPRSPPWRLSPDPL